MADCDLDTPVGRLRITSDGESVVRIAWLADTAPSAAEPPDPVSRETASQLTAYFEGRLTAFDLPIRFRGGGPLDRAVWDAMRRIPWAETRTYADLASETGGIARAVGTACGRNPIPIVVPCHRVVGSDGRLVGFSGGAGIATKSWLLDFERGQGSLF